MEFEYPTANKEYPTEEGTRESTSLGTNTGQKTNTVMTPTPWKLEIPCWLLDNYMSGIFIRPGWASFLATSRLTA